jgi:serine/threonine protein kinase
MQVCRTVQDEPITGYRLLEPLGQGGFGEVWKCEAPGGLIKAIKFVRGRDDDHIDNSVSGADQELHALQYIKSIRHPFLLSIERVEIVGNDLAVVTELADRSLHDLLQEYRNKGEVGVPRRELLGYLREAAEVLDLMNQEYGLKHLDVKPRNLFLVGKHVKVADFGLVSSLSDLFTEGGQALMGAITPLYAAPETFAGQVTLFSDQYSLAVTYHELLMGELPITAKSVREMMLLVTTTEPDLYSLQEADRPILARALAKEPRERYPSCMAFIEALEAAGPPPSGSHPVARPKASAYEFAIGELAKTAVVQSTEQANHSGVYRRNSRIVQAVRPTAPGEGSLPGYQLLECLGRGPAGEVWRARGPRGDARIVRFLTEPDPSHYPPGEEPFDRLLSLHHHNLAALEIVPVGQQRVALVSEAGDVSLLSRFRECQAEGKPGIARHELLGYLGQAADVLDQLYHAHQLQHLALAPRQLTFRRGQFLLLEFGLVEMLWLPEGLQPSTLNSRYAAVELFDGLISDACDQYSLALMFQEMLVGIHPHRQLSARQMASARHRALPDLSLLPSRDRAIVMQALHPDPEKRFRSCGEFIRALKEQTSAEATVAAAAPVAASRQVVIPALVALPPRSSSAQVPRDQLWRPAIEEIVAAASCGHEIVTAGTLHYRLFPAGHIEHRSSARLPPGMARLKITGFREEWQAEPIVRRETRHVFEVRTSGSMLQRCLGRVPGVIVEICLGAPRHENNLTPVRVSIHPAASGRGHAEQILAEMGPKLLRSLQTHLNLQSERSAQERYPLSQPLFVQMPASGQAISAQLRDIGRDGLCLISPTTLPNGAVMLTLTRAGSRLTVPVPGRIRDCIADDAGRFEVEVTYGG